jgi:hypothetical protein
MERRTRSPCFPPIELNVNDGPRTTCDSLLLGKEIEHVDPVTKLQRQIQGAVKHGLVVAMRAFVRGKAECGVGHSVGAQKYFPDFGEDSECLDSCSYVVESYGMGNVQLEVR